MFLLDARIQALMWGVWKLFRDYLHSVFISSIEVIDVQVITINSVNLAVDLVFKSVTNKRIGLNREKRAMYGEGIKPHLAGVFLNQSGMKNHETLVFYATLQGKTGFFWASHTPNVYGHLQGGVE